MATVVERRSIGLARREPRVRLAPKEGGDPAPLEERCPSKVRLVGLDIFKGLLLVKLTLDHLTLGSQGSYLRWVHIYAPWTFGALFFAYGLGIGLSSRSARWTPFAILSGLYVGQILALCFLSPNAHPWVSLFRFLSLQSGVDKADFLLPYILVSFVRAAWGSKLLALPPRTMAIGAVGLCGIARLAQLLPAHSVGSELWGVYGPLTNAPILVGGILCVPLLKRLGAHQWTRRDYLLLAGFTFLSLGFTAFVSVAAKAPGSTVRMGDVRYIAGSAFLAMALILVLERSLAGRDAKVIKTLAALGRNAITMIGGSILAYSASDYMGIQHMNRAGLTVFAIVLTEVLIVATLNAKSIKAAAAWGMQTVVSALDRRQRLREQQVLQAALSDHRLWQSI
jgi:hypothetical protein